MDIQRAIIVILYTIIGTYVSDYIMYKIKAPEKKILTQAEKEIIEIMPWLEAAFT